MNRRMLALVILVLLLVLGLVGLYLYLAGGQSDEGDGASAADTGLVHIRSIYTADGTNLLRPVGVGADDAGGFFITLRDSQKVVEFTSGGDYVRMWGERGLAQGQMMVPLGVAVDRLAGQVYVTDRSRFRLMCYDTQGTFLWEISVLNPLSPLVTEEGVAVTTFAPFAMYDQEGQVLREFGTRGFEEGQFDYPRAAVELENGDIAIADTNNTRVQRVEPSGELTASVVWVSGTPPRFQDDPETLYGVPSGITADERGRLFVLDGFRHKIDVLDQETGEIIHTFDELEGRGDGQFYLPTGIAFLGNQTFAVTDTFNDRVQIVRLLLPDENNVLARNPWLRWLLLLPLLLLLLLFGRKRAFVTVETLDRAAAESNLRLLVGVYKTLYVLPEAYERYAAAVEEDLALKEYLTRLDEPKAAGEEGGVEANAEAMLVDAARPAGLKRLLLPRHTVVCVDAAQGQRCADAGAKRVETYDEVVETYAIKGESDAGASGASAPVEPEASVIPSETAVTVEPDETPGDDAR